MAKKSFEMEGFIIKANFLKLQEGVWRRLLETFGGCVCLGEGL